MPTKIDAAEVKKILEVTTDLTDASINSFIDDAHLIVEEQLVGKGLSDARLVSIEKYLAAHFCLMLSERGGLTSSKDGDAQDNYTTLSPMGNSSIGGLQLTRYGQQALLLDFSNTLRVMSKTSLPAQLRVL